MDLEDEEGDEGDNGGVACCCSICFYGMMEWHGLNGNFGKLEQFE